MSLFLKRKMRKKEVPVSSSWRRDVAAPGVKPPHCCQLFTPESPPCCLCLFRCERKPRRHHMRHWLTAEARDRMFGHDRSASFKKTLWSFVSFIFLFRPILPLSMPVSQRLWGTLGYTIGHRAHSITCKVSMAGESKTESTGSGNVHVTNIFMYTKLINHLINPKLGILAE